jgi:hypothetical protein
MAGALRVEMVLTCGAIGDGPVKPIRTDAIRKIVRLKDDLVTFDAQPLKLCRGTDRRQQQTNR